VERRDNTGGHIDSCTNQSKATAPSHFCAGALQTHPALAQASMLAPLRSLHVTLVSPAAGNAPMLARANLTKYDYPKHSVSAQRPDLLRWGHYRSLPGPVSPKDRPVARPRKCDADRTERSDQACTNHLYPLGAAAPSHTIVGGHNVGS
jgi:hypothetical protein